MRRGGHSVSSIGLRQATTSELGRYCQTVRSLVRGQPLPALITQMPVVVQLHVLASVATIALTTLYAISALANKARASVLGVLLLTLYGLLYVILNAEDYALLIGSSLLFVALAATMYVTRRIDWYRTTDLMAA